MEGKQNSAKPEINTMAHKSPSRDTPNTPSSPRLSGYNGSERNFDGHNNLETNLDVSALLLSSLT